MSGIAYFIVFIVVIKPFIVRSRSKVAFLLISAFKLILFILAGSHFEDLEMSLQLGQLELLVRWRELVKIKVLIIIELFLSFSLCSQTFWIQILLCLLSLFRNMLFVLLLGNFFLQILDLRLNSLNFSILNVLKGKTIVQGVGVEQEVFTDDLVSELVGLVILLVLIKLINEVFCLVVANF